MIFATWPVPMILCKRSLDVKLDVKLDILREKIPMDRSKPRWFAIVPRRQAQIKRIILESFNNHVAPTFVAMTAQVE